MKMQRIAATTLAALAIATGAAANTERAPDGGATVPVSMPSQTPQTTPELLALLRSCEEDSCMAYVNGAIYGAAVWSMYAQQPQPFCAGDSLQAADIKNAIVSTIETTPSLSQKHPVITILAAFSQNWPCMTTEQAALLQASRIAEVPQVALDHLAAATGRMLVLGNPDAGPERTIRVFDDPNCEHCRKFRQTTDALAKRGWKVEIFPVAATSEASIGYGAMAIALRDLSPAAVETLYRAESQNEVDIAAASAIAAEAGLSQGEILTAVARSGAYGIVEDNTRFLFSLGASGTPSWVVNGALYGGVVAADAVELIAQSTEDETAAPSPQGQNAAREEEQ